MRFSDVILTTILTLPVMVIIWKLGRMWVLKEDLELLQKPFIKYGLLILAALLLLPLSS
jgi:hypothetical protein